MRLQHSAQHNWESLPLLSAVGRQSTPLVAILLSLSMAYMALSATKAKGPTSASTPTDNAGATVGQRDLVVQPVRAGACKALVIGNGKRYTDVPPLRFADRDAVRFGDATRKLGCMVTVKLELTRENMDSAISEFLHSIRPDDVAIVYYAGHGVSLASENYLIPVDFRGSLASQVRSQGTNLSSIVDGLREQGASLRILISDACRAPLRAVRGVLGGFAPLAGSGTVVAFAADLGQLAIEDEALQAGVFTHHLLAEMEGSPGLPIDELFRRVRRTVYESTNGEQHPYVYSGLIGDFSLNRSDDTTHEIDSSGLPDHTEITDQVGFRDVNEGRGQPVPQVDSDWARGMETLHLMIQLHLEGQIALSGYDRMLSRLTASANAGELESMTALARLYCVGVGVPRDPTRALSLLRTAAASGDAKAMRALGKGLLEGDCLSEDPAEAAQWLMKAALVGDHEAMFQVGLLLRDGLASPPDRRGALHWFLKSAERGSVDAMMALARMDLEAEQPDKGTAAKWLHQAAVLGHVEAMVELGRLLRQGIGVAQDQLGALKWFEMALEHDESNLGALEQVASLRFRVSANVADCEIARSYAARAVKLGSIPARHLLAETYLERQGCHANYQAATRLLGEAAEADDVEAMLGLANLHLTGLAVPSDPAEGVNWLLKAADLGSTDAMKILASIYQSRKKFTEAEGLLRKAADAQDLQAMHQLGELLSRRKKTKAEGQEWIRKAEAAGYRPAYHPLLMKNRQVAR